MTAIADAARQTRRIIDDLGALLPRVSFGAAGRPWRRARWLHPRSRPWTWTVLVAVGGGLLLAILEALGEGLPEAAPSALLVIAVFVAIEGMGILLGFALFRHLLALPRAR